MCMKCDALNIIMRNILLMMRYGIQTLASAELCAIFQPAFLQAHLPPHPLWLLQMHFTNSLQASAATGNMFHTGTQDTLSSLKVQPQPSGLGMCCSLCSLVHHIPA